MPDLMRLLVQLSGGRLSYEDMLWIATSAVCLLLLLAAPTVFAGGHMASKRKWLTIADRSSPLLAATGRANANNVAQL